MDCDDELNSKSKIFFNFTLAETIQFYLSVGCHYDWLQILVSINPFILKPALYDFTWANMGPLISLTPGNFNVAKIKQFFSSKGVCLGSMVSEGL